MFMAKIDLPAVTCDLFAVTKGFDGNGGSAVDRGTKPRTANEPEARAYADFIRRKNGLPEIGAPALQHSGGYTRGRGLPHFHYVGATYGELTESGRWDDESPRNYIPAQYEPGAYSVLFPGANQMRATVTLETLDDAGEVISSQTMPVDPKKGGVVWSKDDVRKACGPIAKVKANRAPTVAKRRAGPTVDKRRRAIMLAIKLRAELRRERAISASRFGHIMDLTRDLHGVCGAESREDCAATISAADAPATAPDAILSDLAAAEALMRGEGYDAPLPVMPEAAPTAIQSIKRTPAHERMIRRAWAERKARRYADRGAAAFRDMAEVTQAALDKAEAERNSFAVDLVQAKGNLRAMSDRRRLAEQEAAEALAARDDLKRMLADAEARLAAAEAENAQLWAEIETLTAPVPALAA